MKDLEMAEAFYNSQMEAFAKVTDLMGFFMDVEDTYIITGITMRAAL